ncbi:potassium-transporting ATPase subunit C [Betaproteobacteria bacterium SCGC AG-212-J23]|nr:potassium-transporting ATPase subunit C [Betaproteobacteria bacterium SCGC AG-212-J23]
MILQSIRMLVVMTVVTGVAYPLIVTGIAQVAFKDKANGSLIVEKDKIVGSRLIGQPFTDPKYFWSRPSATSPQPYNGTSSSGSNQGPTNPALKEAVEGRIKDLGGKTPVPADLVTASGSGLDPHISPSAAEYQIPRIAKSRNISEDKLKALVARHTEGRQLGVLGEPRVNVLELNLALDAAK